MATKLLPHEAVKSVGHWFRPRACFFQVVRVAAPRPIRLFINNGAPGGKRKLKPLKNRVGETGQGESERVGALVKAIKLRSLP